MLCVVPVRPTDLGLKKLPEEETSVPQPKDTSGVASLLMSQRKTGVIFGPFGLTQGNLTD